MIRALLLALLFHASAWAEPSAEALLRAGKVSEALPVARAEAEAHPADIAAQERYIDLLMTLGLQGLAERAYRERLDDGASADDWYLVGRAVRTAEEAEQAYQEALELDPGHARAHMGLGAVHRATGDHAQAAEAYRQALELDSSLGEAWAGLGAALLSQGAIDEALATARQGMEHVPDEADAYLAVAVLAPDEAIEVLEKGLQNVPGDPRIHAALAEEWLDEGDGAKAKAQAEAALAIDPTRADAQLSLLFAESMAAGHLDAAGYRALVEARGLESADPEAARAKYHRLVERYAQSPLPYMGRARARLAQGDVSGAIADLNTALEKDPSNVEAMGALGMLMLRTGKASQARPLLDRAAEARPVDASLALGAARAALEAGQRDAAKEQLAAAVERFPYDARVVMTYARVLSEGGDTQGAYEALAQAVRRTPDDDRLVLSLAAAAKDLGKNDEAADLLEVLADRSGSQELRELAGRLRRGEL